MLHLVLAEPCVGGGRAGRAVEREDEQQAAHQATPRRRAGPAPSPAHGGARRAAPARGRAGRGCPGAWIQLLAPLGCGSGITVERPPSCTTSCSRPTSASSGPLPRNRSIARRPDRDQQRRPDDPQLVGQPVAAPRRAPPASARGRRGRPGAAGIAAGDRGDVEPLARRRLVEARLREPGEQRAARPARERPAAADLRLSRAPGPRASPAAGARPRRSGRSPARARSAGRRRGGCSGRRGRGRRWTSVDIPTRGRPVPVSPRRRPGGPRSPGAARGSPGPAGSSSQRRPLQLDRERRTSVGRRIRPTRAGSAVSLVGDRLLHLVDYASISPRRDGHAARLRRSTSRAGSERSSRPSRSPARTEQEREVRLGLGRPARAIPASISCRAPTTRATCAGIEQVEHVVHAAVRQRIVRLRDNMPRVASCDASSVAPIRHRAYPSRSGPRPKAARARDDR